MASVFDPLTIRTVLLQELSSDFDGNLSSSSGRARAPGSRYVVIVPYRLDWQVRKENVNKRRENMMIAAIEEFQNMEITRVSERVCVHDKEFSNESCDVD